MERNQAWLKERFTYIHGRHFADIPLDTPVVIVWGRDSYQRLGSIILKVPPRRLLAKKEAGHSLITISRALQDEEVPSLITDQVIAHELVHYVHGFGSNRPKHLKHPHQGGVILREFKDRGLWELYRAYQAWMKLHWPAYYRRKKLLVAK